MNQRPSVLDYISVLTRAILSVICVVAICCAMFFKTSSDPATLSALFLLTGTLIGGIRGPAIKGAGPDGETTMTQTTETVTTPKAALPGNIEVVEQPKVAVIPQEPKTES